MEIVVEGTREKMRGRESEHHRGELSKNRKEIRNRLEQGEKEQ